MIEIIYENTDFIVINKHHGIGFHNEEDELGIFSAVKEKLKTDVLFPVHRLDKVTSGILLFAKNQAVAAELGAQFEKKTINKLYLAISDKKPSKKQGTIKGDMVRSRRSSWKLTKTVDNPAITQFFSYSIKSGLRLFIVRPLTGKTHQIRVALKSIGAPICGDPIYSSNNKDYDRTYLHAFAIKFTCSGEQYEFKCLPTYGELFISKEFNLLINNLGDLNDIKWPKS